MIKEIPNFTNAVRIILDEALKDIKVAIPAVVNAFDASKQQVSVQPDILAVIRNDASLEKLINRVGEKIGVSHIEMPVIEQVPVQYARAGIYSITLPIVAGDTGLLIWTHRNIERWIREGGKARQADLNLFDYSNCVFIPGIFNNRNALSNYNNSALEISAGSDKITMDGSNITITTSGNVSVDATQVDVNADVVNLAGGGAGIARIGDLVNPVPGPTQWQIISGSSKVFSG